MFYKHKLKLIDIKTIFIKFQIMLAVNKSFLLRQTYFIKMLCLINQILNGKQFFINLNSLNLIKNKKLILYIFLEKEKQRIPCIKLEINLIEI